MIYITNNHKLLLTSQLKTILTTVSSISAKYPISAFYFTVYIEPSIAKLVFSFSSIRVQITFLIIGHHAKLKSSVLINHLNLLVVLYYLKNKNNRYH